MAKEKEGTAAAEAGNEQVQKLADADTEKGYSGTVADPTPNENYTVAGVTSGAPTPETDKEAKAKVAAVAQEQAEKNSNLAQ